jgi:hypothetical protein
VHRAVDGATVENLPSQANGLAINGQAIGLLTVGGNDLLRGLLVDSGAGTVAFAQALDAFLGQLPIRPVLFGNHFTNIDAQLARANYARVNGVLAELAGRYGALVDLHAHFLLGDPACYMNVIEPSWIGASEIRRCFLPYILQSWNLVSPQP